MPSFGIFAGHDVVSRLRHLAAAACACAGGPVAALVALLLLASAAPAQAERLGAYDYPFVNPFTATVVTTPHANRAELPDLLEEDRLERRFIKVLPEREIPPAFYYDARGLEYGLARQRGAAPLIFLIAGTGGSSRSISVLDLANAMFADGYHVVTLPSPTTMNFILNASSTGVPGRQRRDAADLYRAMQAILASLEGRIAWTEVNLAGLSLGAMNAAYVAELDSRERAIGFDRALMLNPPVSLYNSTRILDGLFDRQVGNEPGAAMRHIDGLIGAFANAFGTEAGELDLSGDFIYRLYRIVEPTVEDMEALVGVAFRLSGGNIAFTSDVLTRSNYLVPADRQLSRLSSLTDYFTVATTLSFDKYIRGLFLPFYQKLEPGLTFEQAVAEETLATIEPFLRQASHVGLFTNEDDIILAPGELDYLESLFGDRATIFPTGGHCGNYAQHEVVARLHAFFRR